MPAVASAFGATEAAPWLRRAVDADDKYSRGVVGLRTGSVAYPGAAVLGCEAAARAGAGMVRFVGDDALARAVLARRPEVVVGVGRAQAWVIGSGTDAVTRAAADTGALLELLSGSVPVVVDAGALDLIARRPEGSRRAPVVVTPHARELRALAASLGVDGGINSGIDDACALATAVARAADAVVLSKGAVTRIVTPSGSVREVRSGVPWLATAGTGDVLAGVIGALVAAAQAAGERDSPAFSITPEALAATAAAAAALHGVAARIASGMSAPDGGGAGPGHPIVALDVAAALPAAWSLLAA